MKKLAMLVASAALMASSTASAQAVFEIINVSGGDPAALSVGEEVTLQITFTNPDGISIFGVGGSVSEFDEAVVEFASGQAAPNYLNAICPTPDGCFGGLTNLAAGDLELSSIPGFGNRVQIALSAGLMGVANTGDMDPGLDLVVGSSQFDVTFVAVGEGTTTLQVGTSFQGDAIILEGGVEEEATGDSLTITVPEPGAIAASMAALGSVLGLAGIRRRI